MKFVVAVFACSLSLIAAPQRLCIKLVSKQEASRFSQTYAHVRPLVQPNTAQALVIQPALSTISQYRAACEQWCSVLVSEGARVDSVIDDIRRRYAVLEARRSLRFHIESQKSDDSLREAQWHVDKLHAEECWKQSTGKGVRVAFIDTGIDWDHEDLRTQLWINVAEDRNGNGTFEPWPVTETRRGVSGDLDGVDNDGNGFTDDVIGYNFVDQGLENLGDWSQRDPFPYDEVGHGTNVAGVIAAARNNHHGIAGLAPEAMLMTLRAFDISGNAEEDDIAAAVVYAADNHARVLNCSFGDIVQSTIVRDAMAYAASRGVFIVASSGNSGGPGVHFPSDFSSVMSIGASNADDRRAVFSSYNEQLAIVAPGQGITTTAPANSYSTVSGTSFSSPVAAAAAALLLQKYPLAEPEQLRSLLIRTAVRIDTGEWSRSTGGGRLDVMAALRGPASGDVRFVEPEVDRNIVRDTGALSIRAVINDPLLQEWSLQYAAGSDVRAWTELAHGSAMINSDSVLSQLSFAVLKDTLYHMRIDVTLTSGQHVMRYSRCRILPSRVQAHLDTSFGIWHNGQRMLALRVSSDRPTTAAASLRAGTLLNVGSSEHYGKHHFMMIPLTAMNGIANLDIRVLTAESDSVHLASQVTVHEFQVSDTGFTRKKYTAPRLFCNPQSWMPSRSQFVATDISTPNRMLGLYSIANNTIRRTDSIAEAWFSRGVGDSNGDSVMECLVYSGGQTKLIEFTTAGKFGTTLFADTAGKSFWATRFEDVTGDKRADIMGNRSGRFYINPKGNPEQRSDAMELWSFNGSGYTELAECEIASRPPSDRSINLFGAPGGAVGDFDHDGAPDVAFCDSDGDAQISEWNGKRFTNQAVFENGSDADAGTEFCTEVDIDGDGTPEVLSGTTSSSRADADGEYEPGVWTFRLLKADSAHYYRIWWSDSFYGVRYGKPYYNGVAAGALDKRSGDEFVLSLFPNLYVFTRSEDALGVQPLWYHRGAWSNGAMIGDFDANGRSELAFASSLSDSTEWWECSREESALQPPTNIVLRKPRVDSLQIRWQAVVGAVAYRVQRVYLPAGSTTGIGTDEIASTNVVSFASRDTSGLLFVRVASLRSASDTTQSNFGPEIEFALRPDIHLRACSQEVTSDLSLRLSFDADVSHAIIPVQCINLRSADGRVLPLKSVNLVRDDQLLAYGTIGTFVSGAAHLGLDTALAYNQYPPVRGSVTTELTAGRDTCCALSFVRCSHVEPLSITAEFSDVVSASALAIANYHTTQNLRISGIEFADSAHRSVRIQFDPAAPMGARGIVYTIQGLPSISSQSGRSMTTSSGNTLSWVFTVDEGESAFAFPQPFRVVSDEVLHFAGVPRNATVRVMTLDGVELAHIVEQRADGGVEWRPLSEGGEHLSTGVYLFKVILQDGRESSPHSFMFIR